MPLVIFQSVTGPISNPGEFVDSQNIYAKSLDDNSVLLINGEEYCIELTTDGSSTVIFDAYRDGSKSNYGFSTLAGHPGHLEISVDYGSTFSGVDAFGQTNRAECDLGFLLY